MLSIVTGIKRLLHVDQKMRCSYTPQYPDTCNILKNLDTAFKTNIEETEYQKGCCLHHFGQTVHAFHEEMRKLKILL